MLAQLRFVQGAVSKKDLVPVLNHFNLKGGRIVAHNGKMSLSGPIDVDLDCSPSAEQFINALAQCSDTVELYLTPTGRLSVRSGSFRAQVACTPEPFPVIAPHGTEVELGGPLLPALEVLLPFTSEDASRPWAAGVMLSGQSAFATNNVCLVEYWLGHRFPFNIAVPRFAIKEMLRIGEEPVGMTVTSATLTVHYSGDRFLQTCLVDGEWPDIRAVLDKHFDGVTEATPIPEGLADAVESTTKFVQESGILYFDPGFVRTHAPEQDEGVTVEVPGLTESGQYTHRYVELVLAVATAWSIGRWPAPAPFFGPLFRGLIIGRKV